jgi:hypothetical protein
MISRERDRERMRLAVDLSKKSQAENDGRVHPFKIKGTQRKRRDKPAWSSG